MTNSVLARVGAVVAVALVTAAAIGCGRGPLVSALAEHRTALLEHLHDEEEHILPLIAEHLTVAEWARLGERFAAEARHISAQEIIRRKCAGATCSPPISRQCVIAVCWHSR